ncbi:hypothetical protein BD770DRAFT_416453 [Pilaira anomala]|nr:hypothetical protein BD770DRAFT_416453 [Pilaira anomala]
MSAYNSQISNRAMYACRVSPIQIDPVTAIGDFVFGCTGVSNLLGTSNKLEFILGLWVLQNWHNNELVNSVGGDRVRFAEHILEKFNSCVTEGLIFGHSNFLPVLIEDVAVRTVVGNRPVQMGNIREVTANPVYPAVRLECMDFASLLNGRPLLVASEGNMLIPHYGYGASMFCLNRNGTVSRNLRPEYEGRLPYFEDVDGVAHAIRPDNPPLDEVNPVVNENHDENMAR